MSQDKPAIFNRLNYRQYLLVTRHLKKKNGSTQNVLDVHPNVQVTSCRRSSVWLPMKISRCHQLITLPTLRGLGLVEKLLGTKREWESSQAVPYHALECIGRTCQG